MRIIPYSDQTLILHCLTQELGLQSIFVHSPKAKNTSNLLRTGRFIQFKAVKRLNSSLAMRDYAADPVMPLEPLKTFQTPVWLFTLELLNKALQSGQHIPGLRESIDKYYINLHFDRISNLPLIPLIVVMRHLGVVRLEGLLLSAKSAASNDLSTLGYEVMTVDQTELEANEVFDILISRFKNLYNVRNIFSLELL